MGPAPTARTAQNPALPCGLSGNGVLCILSRTLSIPQPLQSVKLLKLATGA